MALKLNEQKNLWMDEVKSDHDLGFNDNQILLSGMIEAEAFNFVVGWPTSQKSIPAIDQPDTNAEARSYRDKMNSATNRFTNFSQRTGDINTMARWIAAKAAGSGLTLTAIQAMDIDAWKTALSGFTDNLFEWIGNVTREEKTAYDALP